MLQRGDTTPVQCSICGKSLDSGVPLALDCGGDCWECVSAIEAESLGLDVEAYRADPAMVAGGGDGPSSSVPRPARIDPTPEVQRAFDVGRSLLSADTLEEVAHYLAHGEPEMAFEGLVLELIEARVRPPEMDFEEWRQLAVACNLHRETVWDESFWKKFVVWGRGLS